MLMERPGALTEILGGGINQLVPIFLTHPQHVVGGVPKLRETVELCVVEVDCRLEDTVEGTRSTLAWRGLVENAP